MILLPLLLIGGMACTQETQDSQVATPADQIADAAVSTDSVKVAIQTCFQAYRSAILNNRSEEAASFVSARTFAYYQEILNQCRHSDSLTVDALPLLDKFSTLLFRARIPKSVLATADGKTLFIYLLNNGMVSKESVTRNELGKIIYSELSARAPLLVDGQATPMALQFHQEAGAWKLDLTSLFPVSQEAFQQQVDETGLRENVYLEELIANMQAIPENALWKPTK